MDRFGQNFEILPGLLVGQRQSLAVLEQQPPLVVFYVHSKQER